MLTGARETHYLRLLSMACRVQRPSAQERVTALSMLGSLLGGQKGEPASNALQEGERKEGRVGIS